MRKDVLFAVPELLIALSGCAPSASTDPYNYYQRTGVYDPTPKNPGSGDEFFHSTEIRLPKQIEPAASCPPQATSIQITPIYRSVIEERTQGALVDGTCTIQKIEK